MEGHTNNPNGRPKGTPNKTTAELKGLIANLFEAKYEDFTKAFDELESKDKVEAFIKIMAFVLPKQKDIKMEQVEFIEQPLFPDVSYQN